MGELNDFRVNEVVESNGGNWQLFRQIDSNIYVLEYWLDDGDYPLVTINLCEEKFFDLATLFPNIKKYRSSR